MFELPSFDEAMELVSTNDAFYYNEHIFHGYEIRVFNYRLAQPSDFNDPKACEMRGLTFVKNGDTWDRFIMLHKFFNVNQTDGYMLDDIKDLKVVRQQEKLDGSMIRFVLLPNNRVVAKTKMGFDNEQAQAANRLYNKSGNEKGSLRWFIDNTITQGMAAIFEYVAPTNRIVVPYKEEKLILLQVRDEHSGLYLEVDQVVANDFEVAYPMDIAVGVGEYMGMMDSLEDVEGCVFTLDNGQMVKVKTKWYCDRHRLLTVDAYHENTIIDHILNETFDDLIATLDSDDPVRENMNRILRLVRDWFSDQEMVVENLLGIYNTIYNKDRKEFAINHNQHPLFGVVMKVIDGGDIYDSLVPYIRKQTSTLEKARKFLKEYGD